MRIDRVELCHLRMPLRSAFETSFGVEQERDCILIRVLSEGLEAWGECAADRTPGYCYETVGTAWHILSEFFVPAILGKHVERPDDFRRSVSQFKGHGLARAGVEMALWDLEGRRTGRSLREMLGGNRDAVSVGVSVGIQPDIPSLLRTVEGYLRDGYGRVKLKIKPGRDVAEARAVRQAHPSLRLQVDANSAYVLEDAAVFEAMDNLDLLLIEQPLAEDDLLDHSRLQKRLRTPLCLDESVLSVRHARQAMDIDACRVINIKPGRVGGLAEAVAIHDLCRARGIPVWCGGMLETGVGRAANLALASLAGFTLPGDISATSRYYIEDIAEPTFILNADSTINVPDKPGLGVTVTLDRLDRYAVRRQTLNP